MPNLRERVSIWQEASGLRVECRIGDCCDQKFLFGVFEEFAPDAVIHYAEQPSAPYSMIDENAALLTLTNNL